MPAKTKFEIKLGVATREAFGRALVELGRENKDVVVCDAVTIIGPAPSAA